MDHGLSLHSDGTLTITLPKDAEVSRVVVNGAEFCASYRQVTRETDCTSRQAVIEALKTDCSWTFMTNTETSPKEGRISLKQLVECHPQNQNVSTHVPYVKNLIVRDASLGGRNEMSDLIDRQAAIDAEDDK